MTDAQGGIVMVVRTNVVKMMVGMIATVKETM
jgi:hypothetical protein